MGVFDYTVSDGLISSVRVADDVTVLQISAPISQGSSGGPLFNPFGEVIGVATAIFAAGQNLNFGIPSNYLRPLLATPGKISLAEFASKTRVEGREPGKPDIKIVRQVPVHELAVLDGCDKLAIEGLAEAISHTISSGAPLYNAGNHEACYRIYEGTVMKYERDAACSGVRGALHAGLVRARNLGTFTEKAWALRDTFDGLIDVLVRHAQLNP
jgi:S1-C subfamily serine protease